MAPTAAVLLRACTSVSTEDSMTKTRRLRRAGCSARIATRGSWPCCSAGSWFCSTDFTLVSRARLGNIGSSHFPIHVILHHESGAEAMHQEPEADPSERELAKEKIDKVNADENALRAPKYVCGPACVVARPNTCAEIPITWS